MEPYPESLLPDPILTPYSSAVGTATIRGQLPGRPKQRNRFRYDSRTQGAVFRFTDFEYAIFQSWYKNKLSEGSMRFTMNLRIGDDIQNYRCQFSEQFSASYDEPYWIVSTKIELFLPELMSRSDYISVVDNAGNDEEDYPWLLLPDPLISSYGTDPSATFSRIKMEGAVRQRPIYDRSERVQTVNFYYTDQQFNLFQAFFEYVTKRGEKLFRMYMRLGDGRQLYDCRFVGGWTATFQEFDWNVSCVIEVLEPRTLSEDTLDLFIDDGMNLDQLEASSNRLYQWVHHIMPDVTE